MNGAARPLLALGLALAAVRPGFGLHPVHIINGSERTWIMEVAATDCPFHVRTVYSQGGHRQLAFLRGVATTLVPIASWSVVALEAQASGGLLGKRIRLRLLDHHLQHPADVWVDYRLPGAQPLRGGEKAQVSCGGPVETRQAVERCVSRPDPTTLLILADQWPSGIVSASSATDRAPASADPEAQVPAPDRPVPEPGLGDEGAEGFWPEA